MKKFLALALVVIMLAVFAVPTFAGDIQITFDPSAKYETYSIVVPVELRVDGAAGQIEVTAYDLADKNRLMVDVVSDFKFGDIEDAFAVKVNGTNDSAVFFESTEETATVAAVSTENTPTAGEYEGYITYNCMIVKK